MGGFLQTINDSAVLHLRSRFFDNMPSRRGLPIALLTDRTCLVACVAVAPVAVAPVAVARVADARVADARGTVALGPGIAIGSECGDRQRQKQCVENAADFLMWLAWHKNVRVVASDGGFYEA